MQRKALGGGKNLALSKQTCLEKERVRKKGDLKKSWSGIETEMRLEQEKVGLEVSLVGIH